ncbi:MAG: hypothetical protein OQK24_01480 [Magnetovibrio sp.]|nr:hypothetical protein [Magnetovibrio sp.]
MNNNAAEELVFRALDDVNAGLPSDLALEKGRETVLLGDQAKIDSLGLMILLSSIERYSPDVAGKSITLSTEDMLDNANDPLKSVGTLSDYVAKVLEA